MPKQWEKPDRQRFAQAALPQSLKQSSFLAGQYRPVASACSSKSLIPLGNKLIRSNKYLEVVSPTSGQFNTVF
jgi:hypothetical protein